MNLSQHLLVMWCLLEKNLGKKSSIFNLKETLSPTHKFSNKSERLEFNNES